MCPTHIHKRITFSECTRKRKQKKPHWPLVPANYSGYPALRSLEEIAPPRKSSAAAALRIVPINHPRPSPRFVLLLLCNWSDAAVYTMEKCRADASFENWILCFGVIFVRSYNELLSGIESFVRTWMNSCRMNFTFFDFLVLQLYYKRVPCT